MSKKPKHNVLVISDTQNPFQHPDTVKFLKAVYRKYKCNAVVHIGDEADHHALGDWDHDPDGLSAGDEHKETVKSLKPFYKAFPRVKICESNHTSRPFRRAFKYGIPKAYLKEYGEFLSAPKGWEWAESWEIDGIRYQHGMGYTGRNGALKAAERNMQSTVIGHLPAHAGIQYVANSKHLIFGMNVGCLIDVKSYAFAYGKHYGTKPIISCGVVLKGVPLLVTMPLNSRGRWTGKL